MIQVFTIAIFFTVLTGATAVQTKRIAVPALSMNPSEWTGKVCLNKKVRYSGKFSFETFGKYPTKTIFLKYIPIQADKTYILSCYLRSLDSKYPAWGFVGLMLYNKDKRLIAIKNVYAYSGTESVLLTDIEKGSKVVFLKKNMNYLKHKSCLIAFNVKDDYVDLPNYNLSPIIQKIIPSDNNLKVIFSKPLKKSYKAGTKVRLHAPWGASFYWAIQGWIPACWKKYSIKIRDIAQKGTPKNKFWKGAKYVKPFIMFGHWRYKVNPKAKLLIDDLSFMEYK